MTQPVNGQAEVIGKFASGSAQWHAARASGVGGSEISAVVGLSPWESRFALWHRKKDRLPGVAESNAMKWGTLLEPVVAAEYAENHVGPGYSVTTGATYRHVDRPWQIANPDLLIWSDTGELVDGVEIKCPGLDFNEKWPPSGSDAIPIYYRCQIAWYCDVMGLDSMILRALIGGNDPRTYRIRPTLEDREFLREEGGKFWHELENDILPNLDSHLATYQALRELHPDIDRSVIVDVDAELADLWWSVQDQLDAAEAAHRAVRIELANRIGHGWKARCGDQNVAYRVRPANGGDPYVKSAPRPHADTSIKEAAA
ncbi:YqaJ viral recombinase family protein [Nocardia vinacea]|uniref:YqaJ viral recombinase family nuclease n=1 Tax=Nocardia vinacea TaxID=96468 RepID=UPI0033ED17CA